jgi:hypothetical protein
MFVEIQPEIFSNSAGTCDFQETKNYKYVAPTALIPACWPHKSDLAARI